MGIFDAIFGDTEKKTQSQQSTQSGTGFSQSNIWPQISPYFPQYANTAFTPAPFNQYQTGAADAQQGVINSLMPAYNAAWNVAGTGITPAAIQGFQNPYEASVVNALKGDLEDQFATDRGQLTSQFARAPGALTGSSYRGEMRNLRENQTDTMADQLAKLRYQGYNQATNTAAQDAALRLQGAGTVAGVTNAATGATTAGFNQGQTLWKNPLDWMYQGGQGITPFAQAAGQNTNFTGQSQGTGTSTSTASPSPFSVFTGFMPFMPKFSRDGGAITSYRHGGAVDAGDEFADKVYKAFKTFHKIRREMGGRVTDMEPDKDGTYVPRRDVGGAIPVFNDWNAATPGDYAGFHGGYNDPMAPAPSVASDPSWGTMVERAPQGPSLGERIAKAGEATRRTPSATGDLLSGTQQGLGTALAGMMQSHRTYADGGDVDSLAEHTDEYRPALGWNDDGVPQFASNAETTSAFPSYVGAASPTTMTSPMPLPPPGEAADYAPQSPMPAASAPPPPAAPESGGFLSNLLPKMSWGPIWQGKPTDLDLAMMSVSSPRFKSPWGGVAESFRFAQERRLKEAEAERAAAALLGKFQGQPTLAAQQHAEMVRHHKEEVAVPEAVRALKAAMPGKEGTPEFQAALLKILTKDRVESEFDKNVAKASAMDLEKRSQAIADSQNKLQTMAMINPLISNPAVYQGAWGESVLGLKKMGKVLADFIGISPEALQGIPESELLRTITNKYALSLRNTANGEGMPGAMSDADRVFLLGSVPGLSTTPAGNAAIVKMTQIAEDYKVRANTEAQRYIQAKKSNVGLGDYMAAWMASNPMFAPETKKEVQEILKATPAQSGPVEGPRATKENAGRLPPSTAIKELKDNANSPEHIASFNKHFNNGQPGLAESLIGDEAAAFRDRESLDLNAPHNLLRRWFGQPPI